MKPKVLGTGAGALALWHACGERHGIRLHRFLDPDGDPSRAADSELPVDRVMPLQPDLALLARREHVNEIVVGLDDRRHRLPVEMLLRCSMQGIRVTDESSFIERATGRLDLESLWPSWLIFVDVFHGRAEAWATRGLDLIFSVGLLAIRLDSPGVQNKVLEAMAMARPVLCTPAAAAGIEAEADREPAVAEGVQAFAATAQAPLDDAPRRQAMAAAAGSRPPTSGHSTWPRSTARRVAA